MGNEHFKPFEITEQGLRMRQMAVAGAKDGSKYTLRFKAVIGEGKPGAGDDPYYMTGVVLPAADMPVKESYAGGVNHLIAVVIDNTGLTQGVMMTEIGVMANLLDTDGNEVMPEAMYGYTYTDKYDYLPSPDSYIVQREMIFDTVLSRTANVKIDFDASGLYATPQDLTDHNNDPNAHGGLVTLATLEEMLAELPAGDGGTGGDGTCSGHVGNIVELPDIGIINTILQFKLVSTNRRWNPPWYTDPDYDPNPVPDLEPPEPDEWPDIEPVTGHLTLEDGSVVTGHIETDDGTVREMQIKPDIIGA